MFHIVQVVSMLEVPISVGSASFQSKEVSGAQYSCPLFYAADRRGTSVFIFEGMKCTQINDT
jgi:hypothetical protein